jgi:hypothetical protein
MVNRLKSPSVTSSVKVPPNGIRGESLFPPILGLTSLGKRGVCCGDNVELTWSDTRVQQRFVTAQKREFCLSLLRCFSKVDIIHPALLEFDMVIRCDTLDASVSQNKPRIFFMLLTQIYRTLKDLSSSLNSLFWWLNTVASHIRCKQPRIVQQRFKERSTEKMKDSPIIIQV